MIPFDEKNSTNRKRSECSQYDKNGLLKNQARSKEDILIGMEELILSLFFDDKSLEVHKKNYQSQ